MIQFIVVSRQEKRRETTQEQAVPIDKTDFRE